MSVSTADLTWRPLTPQDAEAWVELMRAVEDVDRVNENYDTADYADFVADPVLDLAKATVAGFDGPSMVAVGLAWIRPSAVDLHRVNFEGTVHPAHRGQGIGTTLLDRMTAVCVGLHREHHPDLPLRVATRSHEANTGQRSLLVAEGFEPVRWFFDMRADIDTARPVPPLPDGLRLVPYRRDLDDTVRLVSNEAFADHWGSLPRSPQVWQHVITGVHSFRPDLSSLVITDDGEIAAFLLSYGSPADEAVTGRREIWVGSVATRRPWRGQGLATVLLTHTMAQARALGFDRAGLGVDAHNPTGALGVYERCGFQVTERWTNYDKAVRHD